MKPKINILDILKPAEEVEPSPVEQSKYSSTKQLTLDANHTLKSI